MGEIEVTNKEFYNTYPDAFDKIPFAEHLPALFLKYAEKLPGKKVLEVGAGGGAFAFWMMQKGFSITCLEPAEAQAEKIREKSPRLEVYVKTLQEFKTQEKFNGIVAISSLIHIPKNELCAQIKKMSAFLKPRGLLFVSFIEGEGEEYEDPTQTGKLRYFAKYSLAALRELFLPYFSIVEEQKIVVKKMNQSFFLLVLSLNSGIE